MKGTAYALAVLILLAPAAAADQDEPDAGPEPQDDVPCKFFAWTLHPPDYRIDRDCPLLPV